MKNKEISEKIFYEIRKISDKEKLTVDRDTNLIGTGSIFDSIKLVETCLYLETLADELGFEFDWSSENALSRSRGMFRTAGSLADAFLEQLDQSKKP